MFPNSWISFGVLHAMALMLVAGAHSASAQGAKTEAPALVRVRYIVNDVAAAVDDEVDDDGPVGLEHVAREAVVGDLDHAFSVDARPRQARRPTRSLLFHFD